jgi:hypothetical protein
MGAVYTAAVMGTVALADRRGGRALMLMTALALALMCRSLETRTLNDIWNSAAAVMLVPLLIFMCWSLACGDYRLLPATILVASFIAQCHLILVLPALCAVGVGVAGLAHWRWRRPSVPAGRMRWWVAAGVAVAVVCWSAPVVDQALAWTGSDRGIGNLQLLAEAALHRDRPVGTAGGGRAVAQAIGVPPWWLRAPQPPDQRTFAIFRSIPPLRLATTLLVLGALVAAAVAGVMRRRADVVWAAVLALALCAALAATTASFPNTPRNIFSYSYSSWWAMPAGMWAWLVVAWAVLALAPVRRLRRPSVARWPRVAAVAGVTATGVLVVALQHDYALRPEFQPTRTVLDRLEAALPDPGTVRVESSTFPFTSAVIQGLRRRGATIETSITEFGPDYTRKDPPADHVVDIRTGAAPAPGAKVVARARATPKAPLTTVSLRAVR